MAETGFSRTLTDPNEISGGTTGVGGGTGGAVAGFLGGLSTGLDMLLKNSSQNRQDAAVQGLEGQLTQQIDQYSGQGNNTSLVGEQDPDMAAALDHSGTKRSLNQVGTLAAGYRDGKISSAEFYAKTAAITQAAVNANPRFEAQIRQAARTLIGADSSAKQVAIQEQDQQTIKNQQQAVTATFLSAAAQSGIAYFDDSGQLDTQKTAAAGQKVLAQNQQLEIAAKQMDLRTKQAALNKENIPTQAQMDDQGFRSIVSVMGPSLNDVVESGLENLQRTVLNRKDLTDEQKREAIATGMGQIQAQFMSNLHAQLNSVGGKFSAKALKDAEDYFNGQFTTYSNMVSGPLSSVESSTRLLTNLKNQASIKLADVAPAVFGLATALGQGAGAAMVNNATIAGGTTSTQLQAQTNKFIQSQVGGKDSTATTLNHNINMLNGDYGLHQIPDKTEQANAVSAAVPAFTELVKNPNQWDDNQVTAYGRLANSIAQIGLVPGKSDNEIRNSAARVASPSSLAGFDRFASSSQDKNLVNQTAQSILGVAAKSVSSIAKDLKQQSYDPIQSGIPIPFGQFLSPSRPQSTTWTPVYNPNSGQVEIVTQGPSVTPPSQLTQNVNQINQSLNAIVHLKDYGGDQVKGMKPPELKQALINRTGIQIKPGLNPTPVPEQNTQGGSSASPASFTPENINYDRLQKVLFQIESNNNPDAVSDKGAKGRGQVMDHTGRNPGFGVQPAQDDSQQEKDRVSRDYIQAMVKRYNNLGLGLMAYNWGPGNLDKWLAGDRKWSSVPKETRDYISKFAAEGGFLMNEAGTNGA